VQTATRAPFVFVFSGVRSEEKHEETQGFLDVRLSYTHEDVLGQPTGTTGFFIHIKLLYKFYRIIPTK